MINQQIEKHKNIDVPIIFLKELEDRIENHDDQILAAFEVIKKLLSDDKKAATKIGYLKEKQARFGKHK